MDIKLNNVSYAYQAGSPLESRALSDISLTIKKASYTALIGHTGSGKSTLLQHLNALLKPTSGEVRLGDFVINKDTPEKNLKNLRKKIGTVFQFPESQLFEETVAKDIAFGPKNYGATEAEGEEIAREMIKLVGLDESYLTSSPFDLSGGQQRRVAIAGVLALKPEILILDEPTAGLDPKGQLEMMTMFYRLHQEQKLTIILATHQMDQVAAYADQVAVLERGQIIKKGSPREIFAEPEWLREKQLDVPKTVEFATGLNQRFGWTFEKMPLTVDELAKAMKETVFTDLKTGGN